MRSLFEWSIVLSLTLLGLGFLPTYLQSNNWLHAYASDLVTSSIQLQNNTSKGKQIRLITNKPKITNPSSKKGAIYYPLSTAYRVSSRFGPRRAPTSGASRYHKGIDLACRCGSTVYAVARGKVIAKSYSSGYGYYVILDHGGGWRTLYAHLSRFNVGKNELVAAGESIGAVGATGRATGCHLHFELLKIWKRINPERLIEF